MKFVQLIICVLFLTFSFPVFAAQNQDAAQVNVDLTKLSDAARSEILNKLEKEKAAMQQVVNTDSISKLSSVAVEISTCIKDVAKNLNVEVNNFAQTPVGMLTAGLIVWHYIGSELIFSIFETVNGVFIWILLTCIYLYIARRTFLPVKMKYTNFDENGKKIFEESKYVYPYKDDQDGKETKNVWAFLSSLVYAVITAIILINVL